jgi:hypothetical protein
MNASRVSLLQVRGGPQAAASRRLFTGVEQTNFGPEAMGPRGAVHSIDYARREPDFYGGYRPAPSTYPRMSFRYGQLSARA